LISVTGREIADTVEFIGMLSAFMGLLDPGDEVIVFEPFFDQYAYVSYYHLSCNRSLKNSIRRRIFILEIYKC
jgi:hypothetical protein